MANPFAIMNAKITNPIAVLWSAGLWNACKHIPVKTGINAPANPEVDGINNDNTIEIANITKVNPIKPISKLL